MQIFISPQKKMGHGIRHKKKKQQHSARGTRPDGGYKDIVRENDWLHFIVHKKAYVHLMNLMR